MVQKALIYLVRALDQLLVVVVRCLSLDEVELVVAAAAGAVRGGLEDELTHLINDEALSTLE